MIQQRCEYLGGAEEEEELRNDNHSWKEGGMDVKLLALPESGSGEAWEPASQQLSSHAGPAKSTWGFRLFSCSTDPRVMTLGKCVGTLRTTV